jgi:hypothetical protein
VYVADSIIDLPSQEMLAFGMGAAHPERERRSRRDIEPDVRHKGPLLGSAAKAAVRGWLEIDGD